MITNNYYKALAAALTGVNKDVVNYAGVKKSVSPGNSCMNMGESRQYFPYVGSFVKTPKSTLQNGQAYGVCFGDGNTPPTKDDYQMSGNHIEKYEATANVSESVDDNGCALIATYTITNTGPSEITISEVGLFYCTATYQSALLLERTLLESPITIEPGGVGQVTYTIRLNYPTA